MLLLDEDSQAKYLINLLKTTGHDVATVSEAGLEGLADQEVLCCASEGNRVLLTRNCNDFQELHQTNPNHPGILAVYQDADSAKNMSYQAIANAIQNLEASGVAIAGQFIVLNAWNF